MLRANNISNRQRESAIKAEALLLKFVCHLSRLPFLCGYLVETIRSGIQFCTAVTTKATPSWE